VFVCQGLGVAEQGERSGRAAAEGSEGGPHLRPHGGEEEAQIWTLVRERGRGSVDGRWAWLGVMRGDSRAMYMSRNVMKIQNS